MGGCPKHTYLDKDGKQKPAHPLIECRKFLLLSEALQEKMHSNVANVQPVAGAIAYNNPPPPPNPPPNAPHHSHQTAMIQHLLEPRQQVIHLFSITILYHNLLLFIDIFHIWRLYLCYFFYFA
jgi:hypothetical protein